jgi:hypothetical protein
MSVTVTNNHNLPAPIAAWLEKDSYDHDFRPQARSASTIIKSAKKAKLSRLTVLDPDINATWDVIDMLASRRGTAIHDAIEKATIQLIADGADIVQELRLEFPLEVDGVIYFITGKFDAVEDKVPEDWKTESTYAWGDKVKLRERTYQLSIYAWLCHRIGIPCSTTLGKAVSIFNDWSKATALKLVDTPEKYPSMPIMPVRIPLMSKEATEEYMRNQIRAERDMHDPNSVMCTREELWLKEAVWGYYGKAENKKATKNFTGPTAMFDANIHKQSKGGTGVLKEKPQLVKACGYCLGRFNCNQYEVLKSQGLINED